MVLPVFLSNWPLRNCSWSRVVIVVSTRVAEQCNKEFLQRGRSRGGQENLKLREDRLLPLVAMPGMPRYAGALQNEGPKVLVCGNLKVTLQHMVVLNTLVVFRAETSPRW